jgi:hypothetical protein
VAPRIPEIELPPIPASGHRGRRTPKRPPERSKAPSSGPGPWTWIVILLLGAAGGYLGGLGSRALPFGLTGSTQGLSSSPAPATAGGADSLGVESSASTEPGVVGGVGVATRMDYLQGDGQAAEAGTTLPGPFGVQVVDANGQPVDGVEVRFQVVAGGGLATPALARTDSSGRATASWQLGPGPGFHRLTATSPDIETVVTFTAMARSTDGASETLDPEDLPIREVPPPLPPATETVVDAPPPPARAEFVSVVPRDMVVGGSTVCRVSGGGVTCRGANDRGQRIENAANGTRALTAGLFHACALDAAGNASCWGANEAGQLGDGTRSDRNQSTPVSTDLRFSTLSAGIAHTCGLTGGGQLACWGQNIWGQLGDGSREDRSIPVLASTPSFSRLESGWNHTCAMTAAGAVYCWGLNREGQVGDGTRLDRLSPQRVATSAEALSAGSSHTCALSSGTVLCWGDNRFGQLGDGTTESRSGPTPVSGLPGRATALVSGAAHTCALIADGTAHCWGQNLHGQLGNGSTANATTPMAVAGGLSFTRLSAGGAVTCGVSTAGAEYCWGLNQSGQLGEGSRTDRAAPARVGY